MFLRKWSKVGNYQRDNCIIVLGNGSSRLETTLCFVVRVTYALVYDLRAINETIKYITEKHRFRSVNS